MKKELLNDDEALALDKILIEGNEKIIGLKIASGYYGRGGSNYSPYTEEFNVVYTLEQLADREPIKEFGVKIVAVVNDIVYLVQPNGERGRVISFDAYGCYSDSYGIAYDTERSCYIGPVLKENEQ